MQTELKVTGMSCGHCVKAVESALKGVPGVEEVHVDLQSGQASVQGHASHAALVAAVVAEGYQASVQAQ